MGSYTFTRSSDYLNINNKFTESKLEWNLKSLKAWNWHESDDIDVTYCVLGSTMASESSSPSSTGSLIASSYKLKLLNVCMTLQHQQPCVTQ